MKKDVEMKSGILQQLIEAMMGETGARVKPKMVSVEVVHAKPLEGGEKEELEDVLDRAGKEVPMTVEDENGDGRVDMRDHIIEEDEAREPEEGEEEDEDEESKPRMTLQEFLSRK